VRAAGILDEAAWPSELESIRTNLRAAAERLDAARAGGLHAGEIQLVRYPPGGFFMLHRDASEDPKEWRKLSVVVYLNDDFDGGATRFPALELEVPPRPGYALTFPPHYVHEGAPVTRGETFIFTFWLGR
jgi:predicted 2-oxoglutarate/Fe(II)-dependent dioxygenase YbiX